MVKCCVAPTYSHSPEAICYVSACLRVRVRVRIRVRFRVRPLARGNLICFGVPCCQSAAVIMMVIVRRVEETYKLTDKYSTCYVPSMSWW